MREQSSRSATRQCDDVGFPLLAQLCVTISTMVPEIRRQPTNRDRRRSRTGLHNPPRKLRLRILVAVLDAVVIIGAVGTLLAPRYIGGIGWLSGISLTAIFLPLGFVFVRHLATVDFCPPSLDLANLRQLATRFYWGIFPGLLAIVLSQFLIPGKFVGPTGLLIAFIVLALAKLGDVYDISASFRKVITSVPYVTSRKGFSSRQLARRALRTHS